MPPEEDIRQVLLTRARRAVTRAERLVREADALVGTSVTMRRNVLVARCAWCGRYRLGGGWFAAGELPELATRLPEASHTICDACAAELRASGKSR
jgi:NMD protein affecting ribosome stability and mRNA decay